MLSMLFVARPFYFVFRGRSIEGIVTLGRTFIAASLRYQFVQASLNCQNGSEGQHSYGGTLKVTESRVSRPMGAASAEKR
jgi:hypothetical protein